MSMLRPPGLGPIIGHTTASSCRLWIQAGKLDEDAAPMSPIDANRRTIGVIGLLSDPDATKARILKAYYFRLHREFDRTGTFELGCDVALGLHATDGVPPSKQDKPYVLKPDSPYIVRMATLSLDDPLEDEDSLTDAQLREFGSERPHHVIALGTLRPLRGNPGCQDKNNQDERATHEQLHGK